MFFERNGIVRIVTDHVEKRIKRHNGYTRAESSICVQIEFSWIISIFLFLPSVFFVFLGMDCLEYYNNLPDKP